MPNIFKELIEWIIGILVIVLLILMLISLCIMMYNFIVNPHSMDPQIVTTITQSSSSYSECFMNGVRINCSMR